MHVHAACASRRQSQNNAFKVKLFRYSAVPLFRIPRFTDSLSLHKSTLVYKIIKEVQPTYLLVSYEGFIVCPLSKCIWVVKSLKQSSTN